MKKFLPLLGATAALALALTGCSTADTKAAPEKPAPTVQAEEKVKTPEGPQPGETVNLVFTASTEKDDKGEISHFPVEIDAKVTSIEPLTDAEFDELEKEVKEEDKAVIIAHDYYKIILEETYVKGDDPKNQASFVNYQPIDETHAKMANVSISGFDWCKTSPFTKEFINGEVNTSCIVAAAVKGEPAPAGLRYVQLDTKYDPEEGTPAIILK